MTVYGTGAIGGLFEPVPKDQALAALQEAWDRGVRRFDTAPHYGVGQSEEYLGEFLRGRPRGEYAVSTKVGRLLVPDESARDGDDGFYGTPKRSRVLDYSASGVRRSLEESLDRLGLDHVDVVYVHDPEGHLPQALTEAAGELSRMRAEGTIAGYGVGTNYVETAERFVRETDCDQVMIAGRYTLLDRSAEPVLLPLCAERSVTVLAAAVLNSGILAGVRPGVRFGYAPAPPDVVEVVRRLEEACRSYGVPVRAAALQFPLRNPAVADVVVGAARRELVADTAEQMAVDIPDDLWAELDHLVPNPEILHRRRS